MLGIGPIPVGGTEPLAGPFSTTVDWPGVAVAAGVLVLAVALAAILVLTGRKAPEARPPVELPKAA
jgi:hypothetical protein